MGVLFFFYGCPILLFQKLPTKAIIPTEWPSWSDLGGYMKKSTWHLNSSTLEIGMYDSLPNQSPATGV